MRLTEQKNDSKSPSSLTQRVDMKIQFVLIERVVIQLMAAQSNTWPSQHVNKKTRGTNFQHSKSPRPLTQRVDMKIKFAMID